MGQRSYTQDANLVFADGAAAMTASGVTKVGGNAFSVEVGPGRFEAGMLIDIDAIDISSADEHYDIIVQGSNTADFSAGVENLATLDLGATASRLGGAQDSAVGRYELCFQNDMGDVIYNYIRLYLVAAGTTPSITFTAYAGVEY